MRLTKRGKRRLFLLITVLTMLGIGLGALIVARGAVRSHRAEVARETGLAAYARGEYETALKDLRSSLLKNRNDVEALLAFADSRSQVFQVNNAHLTAAVRLYREVLNRAPDNAEALSALLGLYQRLGFYTEWADTADRILVESPDHIDALSAKATVAYRSGRYDETSELTERLSELQPQELSWRARSIEVARARGESDQAILQTIDQWITTFEKDGRFRLLKSRYLTETGDLDAAREELTVAAGLGADSLSVLEQMLNLLEALGPADETQELLASAKVKFPKEQWVYEAAVRRLWRSSRLAEALAELDQAQQALGELDGQLLRYKALVHAARDEKAEARDAIDDLVRRAGEPDTSEPQAVRAWAEAIGIGLGANEETWTETVHVYERAIAMNPRDAILPYLLAQIYQRAGEHDLTVVHLQQVVRLEPRWKAGALALAASLLAANRPTEAFEVLAEVIRRNPRVSRQTYRLLARAWLDSGDTVALTRVRIPGDLLDLLQKLYDEFPQDTEIPSLMAEAYLRKGLAQDANGLVDRVLANPDADTRTLQLLAEVSLRWGLGREEALLTRGVAMGGPTLSLAAARARSFAREGRLDEALALIDAAIQGAADPGQAAIDARPVRLELMLSHGSPDAFAGMGKWLDNELDTPVAALFILNHQQAWEDQELIQRAMDVLETHLGAQAPQVKLAQAGFSHRFRADDRAQIAAAIALVGTVMERTPVSRRALTLMASLLLLGSDPPYDQVIGHLKRAVDLYQFDGVLYPRLIFLLQRQGDFDAADQYLSRLGALADLDPRLRPVELELLKKQGDYEQAIAHLSKWVDSNSPASEQLDLARLLTTVGRYADAEAIFERLLRLPGYSEATAVAAADFFAATGRFDRGLAVLVDLDIDADAGSKETAIAGLYQRYGFENEAADHLQRAIELDSIHPDVWITIANLRLSRGEIEAARQATLKGLQLAPDTPQLQTLLAVISMSLGETDRREAIAMLEDHGSSHPGLLPTVRLYDRIVSRGEQIETTGRDLQEAEQLVVDYPDFLPAWRIAINLHVQAGRIDEAIRLARRATGRLPAEAEPARLACTLLSRINRKDEALDMARLWRQRSLADPLPVEFTIATLLLDSDRAAEAIQQLDGYRDRIWAERGRFPDRMEIWLGAMFESGRGDEAAELITVLLNESEPWGDRCLGMARRLGERSARTLIALIEPSLVPEPAGRLRVAHAWADLARRFDDAAAYEHANALTETILNDPAYMTPVTFLRADIARRHGDFTLAQEHYRSILYRDAGDVVALNNLADVLVRQGTRCNEAVDLAARAAAIAGGNPTVLDTLAQALLCQRRYAEAERQIRAALDDQPTNPSFLVTLTGILYAQGHGDEARSVLRSAQQALSSVKWPEADLLRRIEDLRVLLRGPASTGT